jgi:hypothetical protein
MKKLFLMFVAVLTIPAFTGRRSLRAMEVEAQGIYIDSATQASAPWHGHFLIGGSRLEGSVSLPAMRGVQEADIQGSVVGTEINFAFTDRTPLPAFFSGNVNGPSLSGTYTLADQTGTWAGEWSFSPGGPAPAVVPEPPPARPVPSDAPVGPPSNPCELLSDDGVMNLILHLPRRHGSNL